MSYDTVTSYVIYACKIVATIVLCVISFIMGVAVVTFV